MPLKNKELKSKPHVYFSEDTTDTSISLKDRLRLYIFQELSSIRAQYDLALLDLPSRKTRTLIGPSHTKLNQSTTFYV